MADRRLESTGVALVLLLGGFVWLTRHPDAGIVDRAAGWPLVGGAARAFRDRWRPAPPVPPAPEAEIEYHYRIESDGPAPGERTLDGPPSRATGAGLEIRRFASRDAVERVGPLPGRTADPFRLERARRLLGAGAGAQPLAGYTLWSEAADSALVERWRAVVATAEAAWRERYGVAPVGRPAETIVLFARQDAFARFVGAERDLAALDAHGVAGWGLVVLAAEGRTEEELDGVFQHEIAHLLTRRSIGPALPPWLAEGLAEDFGHARWVDGAPAFDRVQGSVRREGSRFEIRGGLAALDRAGRRAAVNRLPSLASLASLDADEFGVGDPGVDHYADAFAWIRFLTAEPERAQALRAFLADVRQGGSPSFTELERRLPVPADELTGPLAAWLLEERREELARHGAPVHLPAVEGVVPAGSALPPEAAVVSPSPAGGEPTPEAPEQQGLPPSARSPYTAAHIFH